MVNSPRTDDRTRIVAIGEVLIDEIIQPDGRNTRAPGGSPMNTAVAYARQGGNAAMLSPVSTDDDGKLIRDHIEASGVDASLLKKTHSPTTIASATLNDDGVARYTFLIEGHSQGSWQSEHIVEGPENGDVLVVSGSFALSTQPMADIFETLFKVGSQWHTIIFDPNVRPVVIGDDPQEIKAAQKRFDRWVGFSTVVKASEEDVHWRYPDLSLPEIAEKLLELGPSLVVITDGDKGSLALAKNGAGAFQPALEIPESEFKDSIGAGDTFNAGIIKWLVDHKYLDSDSIEGIGAQDLTSMLISGSNLARQVCAVNGANPPWAPGIEPNSIAGNLLSDAR